MTEFGVFFLFYAWWMLIYLHLVNQQQFYHYKYKEYKSKKEILKESRFKIFIPNA